MVAEMEHLQSVVKSRPLAKTKRHTSISSQYAVYVDMREEGFLGWFLRS